MFVQAWWAAIAAHQAIAVGKRACTSYCAEHSAKAKRFPLTCANRFSSLERERDFEEELYYATSDVETL
eukprot:128745-Amphidinium_carterae.1